MQKPVFIILLTICSFVGKGRAQSPFSGMEHLFSDPKGYVASFTSDPVLIDGEINENTWRMAAWSDLFVDIEGGKRPSPRFKTRVKMLWDEDFLYIAADMEEPDVWAALSKRDQIVFHDNDFEVFIDPDNNTHQYFEIEINALNNIFDLFMSKPYRNGGNALFSWNAPGLKSSVKVQGTLNKAGDKDRGWTLEMAIPFNALSLGNNLHRPKNGEVWRINFSRVEWDVQTKDGKYIKSGKPENNWVWSPQGVVEMHRPERWGYLQFNKTTDVKRFTLPYEEQQRKYLWLIYYKQAQFRRANKRYALNLKEIGISESYQIGGLRNTLTLVASPLQFTARIAAEDKPGITINDEGLVRK